MIVRFQATGGLVHDTTQTNFAATAVEPDRGELAVFIRSLFKHASPGGIVSLRGFPQDREGRALFINDFEIEPDDGLDSVIAGAVAGAREAAKLGGVFSPPVATFRGVKNAKTTNLAEGLTISIECDARPALALGMLRELLGPPTLVVASGGEWIDPETGEVQPKQHVHYRLSVPTRTVADHERLKQARKLAALIVGADMSAVPLVHPLRWAGSLHLKDPSRPRLARIVEENDVEISLDRALELLRVAYPDEVGGVAEVRPGEQDGKVPAVPVPYSGPTRGRAGEIAEAMEFIPNDDVEWEEWTAWGLRLYAATAGSEQGFEIFDRYSSRSSKYDERVTRDRWKGIAASPPDRTGAGVIFKAARSYGWKTKPTHEAAKHSGIEAARREIAKVIHNFLHPNWVQEWSRKVLSSAYAVKSETGIGKSETAIVKIAAYVADKIERIHQRTSKTGKVHYVTRLKRRRVGYGVATHKLGDEIVQRFAKADVVAATYRGRTAKIDPNDPADDAPQMCMALDKVERAIEARIDVEKACCKNGNVKCEFYEQCAFQQQKGPLKAADVAIFASDTIFHSVPAIGDLDVLFLDEGFWDAQISNSITISLTKLSQDTDPELRALAKALMAQPQDGPLLLRYAAGVDDMDALRIRLLNEKPEVEFNPSMSASAMRAYALRNRKLIKRAALFRNLADVIPDLDTVWTDEIEVSGRLSLGTEDGERVLHWCGVRKVTKQFRVPTMMMDATLPPLDILRLTHPRVQMVADIRVAMPSHVRIVQITDAPTSKNKLISGKHKEKHQREIVRHIIRRWLECERGKTLVIVQKEFRDKVLAKALPKEIEILHFNALSGIDKFKDVRLCIIIGRTLPKSGELEGVAAILTGAMPECVMTEDDDDDGSPALRYDRVIKGIRLRDGSGIATYVNQHPDPMCEALRSLACESELMQAIGRPRGINRDASSPLDLDLMFDEVLEIEVDAVETWERPSAFYETARDGVMLTSPDDLTTIWPDLFPNRSAAKRAVEGGLPELPGFEAIQYQHRGAKQKWRTGKIDRSIVADPLGWLIERLGPVTLRVKS